MDGVLPISSSRPDSVLSNDLFPLLKVGAVLDWVTMTSPSVRVLDLSFPVASDSAGVPFEDASVNEALEHFPTGVV